MYFKYNDMYIYYKKYGDNKKKVLIILPGWGDNRKTFDAMIEYLKDQYTIYIFDYPAFGNSSIPEKELNIYDYAKIIISFMNYLNINNPTVIAHSFGGRITITMAGHYNIKFNKIILMSAAGIKPIKTKKQIFKQNLYKALKKVSKVFPPRLKNAYLRLLINIFGSSDYKSLPPSLNKTFINIINEDLTNYLNNIKSDVLILWGENDIDTPLKDAYTMNNLIKDSGLIIVRNSTHFFYLEKPLYVKKILLSYLKS